MKLEVMNPVNGEPGVVAILLPIQDVPAMKELCLVADRTSTNLDVKKLAWDIFNALDKLPKEGA
jgi:hypothetical protein